MTPTNTGKEDDSTALDDRSNYDYVGDDVEYPDLVADLRERIDGEVRFDVYTRQLYATDASAYEVTPIGVIFPRTTAEIASVVRYCADREIPVLPRGGGTSLAGQTVNEAIVLDFTRHMDDVLETDTDARIARVQAGTVLEDLNRQLAADNLKFAPDPASGNRSVIGGAIGNNSTGAHSLKYGKTDAYIESCEVVLADGTVETLGEIEVTELRNLADPAAAALLPRIYAGVLTIIDDHAEDIEARYPALKRNVSGYNLDRLLEEAATGTVNLARLLAGSEGTLAIVTEATVTLESVPETKAIALLTYERLHDAVSDVEPVLEHDPAAVELIDDMLLELASKTAEFAEVVSILPDETNAALLVEFYASDDREGREKVARLVEDRVRSSERNQKRTDDEMRSGWSGREAGALEALEAHEADKRATFWKMRKAANPILLSRTSDAKHISFIEDCAVPAEHLPEFVDRFQDVLEKAGTFASFYGHAGPGVLHIRPLIDSKSARDREAMVAISDAVTDLVVEFGGAVSGEHGDGRARTQWNRKLYGEDLWQAFRDLKTAFDPDWLLNPGQVCGDIDMTENLRFDSEYEFDLEFEPTLEWDNENGMQGMVELCHGCGGCRGTEENTGGVMCPTYRAADEEITTTRGRANMLRQAISGDLPDDPTDEEFATEVLDLCIGCKGCTKDCPSEVDMAKLKAEVSHARHQREGASLRDRLFANVDTLASLGSATAPLSNVLPALPGARRVAEQVLGIASERTLPTFERETLKDWFQAREGSRVPRSAADRHAILFPDTYTNYSHPEVGRAAVRVLEAAGIHVALADQTDSGRPAHSKGFLEQSRATAAENVDALVPRVNEGWDIVLIEPSDAVMFQSDYLDLLSGMAVETVADNTYGACEYLDTFRLDETIDFDSSPVALSYHGHCHQKATMKDHHAVGVLRRAGYNVDPIDSTCCGMAGTFGYEAEHHAMSTTIGEILEGQLGESTGELVVAPGASCRTQLEDLDVDTNHDLLSANGEGTLTPIQALADALPR
ncbi:lactate utilization protein A [Halalkalicoccus paucihalophilus]|uniref:D-lactate dehydrogenase (cytochrome) n=1 Tax=Halalkalicoccus paucihalophilus TaxID=1008153 RepID=A0A151AA33_9EURY|nr:FAD-binding and (Fe-S)-binding domain-containing protein [Halalkalicoccus paucihalophilus]KYH24410.1 lactate utilization protein A [Halalkalicoccus paucihalophilus]